MKVDEEVIDIKNGSTWRGYEAGPDGLELLVIGAASLGEVPREDVDGHRGWWGGAS